MVQLAIPGTGRSTLAVALHGLRPRGTGLLLPSRDSRLHPQCCVVEGSNCNPRRTVSDNLGNQLQTHYPMRENEPSHQSETTRGHLAATSQPVWHPGFLGASVALAGHDTPSNTTRVGAGRSASRVGKRLLALKRCDREAATCAVRFCVQADRYALISGWIPTANAPQLYIGRCATLRCRTATYGTRGHTYRTLVETS